ncbi:hypothetical protein DRO58_01150 [Candidatus Bathyarchaeota archaeon]|nr:MAG: hypothetical protein DRO58_01150 [Candidatus Bathyarchaeota archaeon]
MRGRLSTLIAITIFTLIFATNLNATSQIILRNRSAVARISDRHALLHVEVKHVKVFQTSGEVCILRITNRTPERLTITVDAKKAKFMKALEVDPCHASTREKVKIILHYDASHTDPGTYSLRLVIKARSRNLKVILYREVKITVEEGHGDLCDCEKR